MYLILVSLEPIPLRERPIDRLLIAGFLIFASTSFFVDRLAALDVDFCGEQRMWGALCWYGRTLDPLFLANPQWLRVMSGELASVLSRALIALRLSTVSSASIRCRSLIAARRDSRAT